MHAHDLTVEAFGVIGLTPAFAGVFYLADTCFAAERMRLAAELDRVRADMASHLTWGQHHNTLRWRKESTVKRLSEWLPEVDADRAFEFRFHGGAQFKDASDWSLSAFGEPQWQGGCGYVQIVTPLAPALNDPRSSIERVHDLAQRLRPVHGWAGPTLAESPEVEFTQAFQPEVWRKLQARPGLMTDDPVVNVSVLRSELLAGAWLSIVGTALLERIDGGLIAEDPQAVLYPYDGGTVIAASPTPCLEDSAEAAGYDGYRAVAKALDAVRIHSHSGVHFAGPDRMHAAEMKRWLARFD